MVFLLEIRQLESDHNFSNKKTFQFVNSKPQTLKPQVLELTSHFHAHVGHLLFDLKYLINSHSDVSEIVNKSKQQFFLVISSISKFWRDREILLSHLDVKNYIDKYYYILNNFQEPNYCSSI